MAASIGALLLLTLCFSALAGSVTGTPQRKLLQQCPSATPNPCYNADGNAFTCCAGSCGSPPGAQAFCAGATGSSPLTSESQGLDSGFLNGIDHVLIISVDGLHEQDVEYFLAQNPDSAGFGWLAKHGTHYTNAFTTTPSDSFPGTLAILTGGGAYTSGFYYDDSYNRALSPPISFGGDANCSTVGTEVLYDESIEIDSSKLNGGATSPGEVPINPDNLPRDPKQGCKPVYPNELVRINTIYEVAAQAGLYTAFADKHIGAYTIARGPSGTGVSDYASLEIATTEPQYTDANGVTDGLVGDNGIPIYDALKVAQAINWIDGFDHTRTKFNGKAPAIMYYNYQVVSVNQKLAGQGYVNDLPPPAGPVPTEYVRQAIAYADRSIGQLIAELEKNQILGKTALIVTAKHGQSPIDPSLVKKLKPGVVTDAIAAFLNDTSEPAQLSADDSLLIWLHDTSKGIALRDYLNTNKAKFLVDQCFHYTDLGEALNDYVPDIQCKSIKGTIYTGGSKIAEHGGFADDDTHVPIFVANKYLTAKTDSSLVATKQIAPTTLTLLGLDYTKLQAVGIEGTQLLPNTGLY